jgi:hypothetical protein
MAAKLNLVGFVLALDAARAAGAAAGCDYPNVPAEQAWFAWFDGKSDEWQASINDATETAMRNAFLLAWSKEFSRRYPETSRMVS